MWDPYTELRRVGYILHSIKVGDTTDILACLAIISGDVLRISLKLLLHEYFTFLAFYSSYSGQD